MKKTAKNFIWGFASQLMGLAVSIILPRLIILSFGSEINGITSTVTQIFVYIGLLEAGIGSAALARLYKDFSGSDREGISRTVCAARTYYRKLLPGYIACVAGFALVFPLITETDVPARTVRFLILIQGLCGTVNFLFTNAYLQLLTADGRTYITSSLTLLVKVISGVGQIVLIHVGCSIIAVQLSLLCANAIQAVFVRLYVRRQYPWLNLEKSGDISLLDQRKSFIVHELSGVVFNSTDLFLISVFASFTDASVYAVYSMVFVAVSNLMSIFIKAVDYKLGTEFHRDRQQYLRIHDFYETVYSAFVFAVISAAYMVTLPFIRLYTAGVTDANYLHPLLPLLFALIQLVSSSRAVCAKLIAVSGRAKDTIPNTLTETAINLVASLLLIQFLGMIGALLGTVAALLYRTNDILIYANRKILNRSPAGAYRTLGINLALFGGVILVTRFCPVNPQNYIAFLAQGAMILAGMLALYFGTHFAVNSTVRKTVLSLTSSLIRRK